MTTRRRAAGLLVIPVVVASAVGVGVVATRHDPSAPAPTAPEPIVVQSVSSVKANTLVELVAASDSVVTGRVDRVERGRVLSTDGGAGIVTRLVYLSVDQVLAGADPGDEVIVEEEGWLTDGTPILVDGLAASAVGDVGIWFLVDGDGDQFPYHAVIGDQGRYLVDPADTERFLDVPVEDPLIDQLESQAPYLLRHQVEQAAEAGR